MNNPFSQLVPVEERDDGVYIKVTSETARKVKLQDLVNALDRSAVINCDPAAITVVFQAAHGEFEIIGPPFEYYHDDLDSYFDVRVTPMTASLKISSTVIANHIKLSAALLRHCLVGRGVRHGIREDVLQKLVAEPVFDAEVVVAQGTAPQHGKDAEVIFEVQIGTDARPTVGQGGKADYREIQSFTSVKQGQVIARRIPPQPGTPGKSVTGEEIAATDGKDAPLPGVHTAVSDDGLSLLAEKTGVVYVDGHTVHVEELLQVKSDVDFSVGNIKYAGDVVIKGNVMPGFVVEAEGNIEIGGEVESAKVISRNGTVTVSRGIIGKGETQIYGKNGVHIGFAQEAQLQSDATVTIEKSCLHCTIACAALEATQPQASIVGGSVQVYERIDVMNLGNNNGVPTKVELINKEKVVAADKLKELEVLREKINKQLVPILRDMKTKSALLKKVSGEGMSDRNREQLKKLVDGYNVLNTKLKYIEKKIEEVTAMIEAPSTCDGTIRVRDTVYPGVDMSLYGIGRKVIKTKMTGKIFKIQNNDLQIQG